MINFNVNATFEVKLCNDVYWVPISSLGGTNYSNDDLITFLYDEPEEKYIKINTLFECIQLFQCVNFKEAADNIKIDINNLLWEFHKPGYDSVKTNLGCCSSIASWLTYMLDKKYDSIGILNIHKNIGNGHCINFIKLENWFYFFDLSTQVYKNRSDFLIETGNISILPKVKYFTELLVKAKSIYDYQKYYKRFFYNVDVEHFFISFSDSTEVPPTCVIDSSVNRKIFYPYNDIIYISDIDKLKHISFEQINIPAININWYI